MTFPTAAIARGRGAPARSGHTTGHRELANAALRAGLQVRPGGAVPIRTAWLKREDGARGVDSDRKPGLGVEAALWLADSGVAMVGAGSFAIEALPFAYGTVFPVNGRLMRDYGVSLLEGCMLQAFGETGATAFLFAATPLPVVGAAGSPVAPVAVP